MYTIDVHPGINMIITIFYRFGLWSNEDGIVNRRKLFILLLYMSFPVFSAAGAIQSDNNNDMIFATVVALTAAVFSVKLFYILSKKGEILEFIRKFGVHYTEDIEEFTRLNNKVEKFMKFVYCFVFMAFNQMIFVSIFPLMLEGKNLPIHIGIIDWKNNDFAYWTAYTYVNVLVFLSAGTTFLSIIIWYLMLNDSIKFQVLGSQFRNMIANTAITTTVAKTQKNSNEQKPNLLFRQDLITLMKDHQRIQETTYKFKSCFSYLFFLQITTSGLSICGSIYTLIFINENLIQSTIFAIVLIYNIFEIFIVMYFGNEIKLSSDRLSYCLFESNWTEQSETYKKSMIILMEVLKRPKKLVVGKLYALDLQTFTSILKLAYSMFNILQKLT